MLNQVADGVWVRQSEWVWSNAGTTISRAEFKHVRQGMSRARVREVLGFDGEACWAYSGRTSCNYDMMPFRAWAMITHRDGRVVEKHWDVDHD